MHTDLDTTAARGAFATHAARPGALLRPLAALLASSALLWPAWAGRRWGPQRLGMGIWYRLLHKPAFQPPDKVFPVAWTLIDSSLAVGGYRLLRHPASRERDRALGWWLLNVAMIGGWSHVFFGRRDLAGGTALAAAMVGTGSAYVVEAQRVDRPAAAAGLPYLAWVGFAAVLSAAIWRRNR